MIELYLGLRQLTLPYTNSYTAYHSSLDTTHLYCILSCYTLLLYLPSTCFPSVLSGRMLNWRTFHLRHSSSSSGRGCRRHLYHIPGSLHYNNTVVMTNGRLCVHISARRRGSMVHGPVVGRASLWELATCRLTMRLK